MSAVVTKPDPYSESRLASFVPESSPRARELASPRTGGYPMVPNLEFELAKEQQGKEAQQAVHLSGSSRCIYIEGSHPRGAAISGGDLGGQSRE